MKHREGESLFFIPLGYMACTVIHVTPYHEDGDPHAFVTVKFQNGDLCNVPVAKQDDFLATEAQPKQRPEKQPVVQKAGPLQSILDKFRRIDDKR